LRATRADEARYWTPFRFLGFALAISIILAFPIERVAHDFSVPGSYWVFHSCEELTNQLSLGSIFQAILTPIFIFLLPGPGSLFHNKNLSPSRRPSLAGISAKPVSFIAAGCLFAAAVAVTWWYGLRAYAAHLGVCPDLFDLSRSTAFHVDYLSDCAHYFIYISIFSVLWVGVTAGGLRLQAARAAAGGPGRNELRQFQRFYWACFLGWAVQYRVSQWFAPLSPHRQEWDLFALFDFLFVAGTSLWVLAFTGSLWRNKPDSWLRAVVQAFWRTFVILLLSSASFFWLFTVAFRVVTPALVTWNAFGLAWAVAVGTWRWRALQKERLLELHQTPVG